MSATINENATKSVSNQEGQIGSHVPPSKPLTTHGHKPGVLASQADRAPEFQAETLPAGTAPSSKTYTPNPDTIDPSSISNNASDTLLGDTSADVHTGLGHPGQGMSSSEMHHDGQHHRKRQGHGLAGVGASVGDVPEGGIK